MNELLFFYLSETPYYGKKLSLFMHNIRILNENQEKCIQHFHSYNSYYFEFLLKKKIKN